MKPLYQAGLVAALAMAALWAQEPIVSHAEIQEQVARARAEVERARDKIGTLEFDLDFDFNLKTEPMLLAQTIAEKIGEKVSEKVSEKFPRVHVSWERSRDLYNRGMDALDQRDYERALKDFDQYFRGAAEQKDSRADGALYWKAYTLNKLGRRDEALATLAQMEKTFPSSRWLNDARALQLEVKQAAGHGASPESQTDEDLKLLAINGLMNTDAERVVPLLEKLLADPKSSPRLKTRALFVLGQSRNPKAGEIIARYAKGGGNPDVQLKAVEFLGIYGTPANKQVLADVYGSTSDLALKRAVLRAYVIGRDKDRLLAAAKSENNADLRREAIRDLGALGAHTELAQLYTTESNAQVKRAIIQALGSKRDKTPDLLASMYGREADKNLKREMLRSLHGQGAAKQLVEIARQETDPALRQEAVRELSTMRSKESQDYLMELLNK